MLIDLFKKPAEPAPHLGALARMLLQSPGLRDAYGALYAGMRLDTACGPGSSVLVTSTQPSEGKSTIASCLAMTAVFAGQTALLVDGDLRRPWLATATGIAEGVGFGDILEGGAEFADVTRQVTLFGTRDEAYRLSVICAGRRSPAFLPTVDWAAARASFRSFSRQFGIVVLDSPPILAAKDALLLAGIVDAVLLVVAAGSSDRDEVRQAKEQLEPTGARVLGAVLNKFDPKAHGRSNQPYSDHYLEERS